MTKTLNKIVLFNKSILFNKDDELLKENLPILDLFYDADIIFCILCRYQTRQKIERIIPEEYKGKVKFLIRGNPSREKIIELKKRGLSISIVGTVDQDAIFSFNCKIPLFNLKKHHEEIPAIGEKVIRYGLPVKTPKDIIDCLKAQEIHKVNYFELSNQDDKFDVFSLNNANWYYKPEDEVRIKKIFETNLKSDERTRDQKILLLLFFNLLNEISNNEYFEQIKYWGIFPSSDPNNVHTSVSFIKEAVRVLVGGMPRNQEDILIRKYGMNPKNKSDVQTRLSNKCDKDFDTLIVNPKLKAKLTNEVVCIIDDYITNGYSAEATKHLLTSAGAKKVIFISFGKFGRKYFSTNYSIEGNVFESSYKYQFHSEVNMESLSKYNVKTDVQILNFDKYL